MNINRPRRSTLILAALFVLTFALYLAVRPEPAPARNSVFELPPGFVFPQTTTEPPEEPEPTTTEAPQEPTPTTSVTTSTVPEETTTSLDDSDNSDTTTTTEPPESTSSTTTTAEPAPER